MAKTSSHCIPLRYVIIFATFFLTCWEYITRVNLGVTIVAMINETDVVIKNDSSSTESCPRPDGGRLV